MKNKKLLLNTSYSYKQKFNLEKILVKCDKKKRIIANKLERIKKY